MKKKWLVLIFFLILLFSILVFFTNFFISLQLKKKSYLEQVFIPNFINAIKINDQNFSLEYFNYEYHIFLGLKVNEVIIKNLKNQEITCRIENIYILSNWIVFSYNDIKKVVIESPDCNFQKNDFYDFFTKLQIYLLTNKIDLEIHGKPKSEHYAFSDEYKISLKPIPKENKIRIKGLAQKREKIVLKLYGFWNLNQNSEKNTIYFEFYNFPVLIQKFFSKFFGDIHNEFFSENKLSFFISGKGSVALTKEGYAFHFITKFKEFQIESNMIQVSQSKGDMKFLLVESWDSKILKKEIYLQSQQISFFAKSDSYEKDYNIEFDIKLKIENAFFKTPWNTRGELSFKGNLSKKAEDFTFSLLGNFEKLIFIHIFDFPIVFFREGKIYTSGKNQLGFEINGKFSSLNFLFNGNVAIDFYKSPNIIVKSQFIIPDVDYQNLLESLIQIFQKVKHETLREDSIKFIDFSLTSMYKFQNSEIYSKYLRNIDFLSDIQFKFPKQNLPELFGYLKTNQNGFSLLLEGNDLIKSKKIKLNYSIDYLTNLPYHSISIFLDLIEPEILLPFFCSQCNSVIKRIFFEYNSFSNGISIADLYLNNFSNLYLQIENIKLENDYRRELLEKFLETDWREDFFDLKAKYNSNGASYDFIEIKIQNEKIHLEGYGSYNLYVGGKLTFNFIDKKNQLYRNFSIKIRRDGSWVPLYFF